MNNTLKQNILLALKIITGLASGYYLALFLYISLSRLSFPFTLDWIEGPTLVQVNRVLLGQPLFVAPSASYVPLVYQPLYYYVVAAFAKLLGLELSTARLVSILASLGSILLIFLITRKVTNSSFSGIVAAGLFAASNGIVWTWFDFARVDTLCVFLALVGLWFLIQSNNFSALLAGLFFTLSFFSKQSAIIIIGPAFVFYFFVNRKRALLFIATVGLLTLPTFLFLNYVSSGWYYLYAFTLPSYQRLDTNPAQISYIVSSLFEPVLLIIGILLISILTNVKRVIKDKDYFFVLGLAGSTAVLTIISALGVGATRNAFIPAYALIAIVCGKGLQVVGDNLSTLLSEKMQFICNLLLIIACLGQFAILQYKAKPYIPNEQDFNRAKALIKELQDADEEFLFPSQNYLALYVHKNVYYHEGALGVFTGWYGKSLPEGTMVAKEIQETVQSKQVSAVYLTEPIHEWMGLHCEKEDARRANKSSKYVPTVYKMRCY